MLILPREPFTKHLKVSVVLKPKVCNPEATRKGMREYKTKF